jgi:hypothetical protein
VVGPAHYDPPVGETSIADLEAAVRNVCATHAPGGPLPAEQVERIIRTLRTRAVRVAPTPEELADADPSQTYVSEEMVFAMAFHTFDPRSAGVNAQRWPGRTLDALLAIYDGSEQHDLLLEPFAPLVAWIQLGANYCRYQPESDPELGDSAPRMCVIADETVAQAIATGPSKQRFHMPVRIAASPLPAFSVQGPPELRPVVMYSADRVSLDWPVLTNFRYRTILKPDTVIERVWLPKPGLWYARVLDENTQSDSDPHATGPYIRDIDGHFRPVVSRELANSSGMAQRVQSWVDDFSAPGTAPAQQRLLAELFLCRAQDQEGAASAAAAEAEETAASKRSR